MVLLGRYSQIDRQITAFIFQIKSYYLLQLVYHIFQHQGIVFNSCRPMRRWQGQMRFWSFLLWWKLMWVSHTIISHQVLYLWLIWFLECIYRFGLLKLMDVLVILFWTIPGINVVHLGRLFMQDWKKWYSKRELNISKTKIIKPSGDEI